MFSLLRIAIEVYITHEMSILIRENTHKSLRAYLHGGGGPQVDEETRLGGVTRLSI